MFWSAILAFSLLQFHYYAKAQSLRDMAQLFLTTHIVPDILPAFNPSVLVEVSFNTQIIPGQNLTENGTEPDFPVFELSNIYSSDRSDPKVGSSRIYLGKFL